MKKKVLNVILTVFLYLLFVLLWGMILLVLTLLQSFDTFIDRFGDGVLLDIFAGVSILGFIIVLLCRKKMKYLWMMPLCLIIATIITTTINYGILYVSLDYISVYTREKWDANPMVRYRMLDSLNEQYEFIGMTEQELTEILGQPTNILHNEKIIYQYRIGDDKIDGYSYDFIFVDGVVVKTTYSQN